MSYKNHATVNYANAAILSLVLCIIFFTTDVVMDIYNHWPVSGIYGYGANTTLHTKIEALAVIALAYSVYILRGYVHLLRAQSEQKTQTILLLRGSFEIVLSEKFDQWGLTPAERDVALFIIKGLSAADIALARQTAPGTVKAQSNAIFKKIGVTSKTELMSVILDEFLEGAP